MNPLLAAPLELPGGIRARWTGRAEGDLGPREWPERPAEVEARRRRVVDLPWSWIRQVHGAGVVEVAGRPAEGPEADAQVGAEPGVVLAVFTADCAPLVLASPEGVMAAVHAGWRGLAAGVVGAAADAMRRLGAGRIVGALGPCIRPECYEFGREDLAEVERALGAPVAGRSARGRPALDLPGALHRAAASAGVEVVYDSGVCTACSTGWFSHRARAEPGRQALAVWRR